MKQSLVERLSLLEGTKMEMEALQEASVFGIGGPDPEVYQKVTNAAYLLRLELETIKKAMANPDTRALLELNGQLQKAQADGEAAIERLKAAETAAAERSKNLSQVVATRKVSENERVLASAQRNLDDAIKAEEDYAKRIQDIRAKLASDAIADEDTLRSIRQKTMTEEGARADVILQINEKIAASRAALESGDAGQATKLAEDAKGLASSLEDAAQAETLFTQAASLAREITEKQLQDTEETQQKLQAIITNEAPVIQAKADISQAAEEVDRLKKMIAEIKDKTV
jgi:hypothetical protein